ncbi:MAG: hypothetical protein M3Q07_01295 [Pseudobdellovibrionaceae bacterium]|nr:hypothetical protein [Pseudobdellovibrionaceae bacterium]
MKKTFIALGFLLAAGSAGAGQVGGGGGTSAMLSFTELLSVYDGAQKFSKRNLGAENLFTIDMQNQVVTFDVERKIVEESPVLTFDEVKEINNSEPDIAE